MMQMLNTWLGETALAEQIWFRRCLATKRTTAEIPMSDFTINLKVKVGTKRNF
jgi:hypothetical protein